MKCSIRITRYFFVVSIIMLMLAMVFFISNFYLTYFNVNYREVQSILEIIYIVFNPKISVIYQSILLITYFILMMLFLIKVIKIRINFLFYLLIVSGLLGFVFYPISFEMIYYLIRYFTFNIQSYSNLLFVLRLMRFFASGLVLYYFIQNYRLTNIQNEKLAITAFIIKTAQLPISMFINSIISKRRPNIIYYQISAQINNIIGIIASTIFVIYIFNTIIRLKDENKSYLLD